MQQANLAAAAGQLQNMCVSLESLAQQTVAHRRKFQFAVSQLRQFCDHFASVADATPLNRVQFDTYKFLISDVYKEFTDLFKQNMLQTWAQTALENPTSDIPTDLCTLTSDLQEKTSCLDQVGSQYFNSTAPQWLQLHLLDIRAISASFQQFMQVPNQDPAVKEYVVERLHSIDQFLATYKDHDSLQSGLAVFSPIPVTYQSWRLKHTDLQADNEIGSGVSAVVYSGTYLPTGEAVAIKKLKFKKLTGPKLQAFQRELAILATAIHPTVLKFIGATDFAPFSIVTEWMPGGSLYHDIHQNHRLDVTDQTIALFDIARGMRFLHSRSIIHRDLKTLNVLIDKNNRAKICDFGFSKQTEENQVMTMNIGTPHWMAPELLNVSQADQNAGQYNSKVDVYAYAIVMWEVLTHDLPYRGLEATQIIAQVLMNDARPAVPRGSPKAFVDLMKSCWARDPINRPSFAEIVRTFRTGEIYLEGTDHKRLMEYIDSCGEEADLATQQLQTHLNSLDSSSIHFSEFISMMENEGVPEEQIDACWSMIHKHKDSDVDLFIRGLIAFLNTRMSLKAGEELRELPSIPTACATKIANQLPTGDEKLDEALSVCACKNGCATTVLATAINAEHIKLALECIAQKGCKDEEIPTVVQIAKKQFLSQDPMMSVSVLRCLVGLQQYKEISVDIIRTFLGTSNNNLKQATYVTAIAVANQGIELPVDLIDGIASRAFTDPFGTSVLIAACNHPTTAAHLLQMIEHGLRCPITVSARMILVASKHKELKPLLQAAVRAVPISHDQGLKNLLVRITS